MQRIACVSAALAALALSARPAGEAAVVLLIHRDRDEGGSGV